MTRFCAACKEIVSPPNMHIVGDTKPAYYHPKCCPKCKEKP